MKKENKKTNVHKNKLSEMILSEAVHSIEEYNRKHGTCYTYGQAVMLAENGKIEF